jgi:ABC-type Zn uptake system ZnuABC Zn-binding protein ZnuA
MTIAAPSLILFNGSRTIRNRGTGEHRTFKVRTVLKGNLEGKRIIALLTGPDNTSHYKGFGFVTDNGIQLWHKYSNDKLWKAYAYMITKIVIEKDSGWTNRYEHMLEGHCCRCNRLLTHPGSIETGIGPECRKQLGR